MPSPKPSPPSEREDRSPHEHSRRHRPPRPPLRRRDHRGPPAGGDVPGADRDLDGAAAGFLARVRSRLRLHRHRRQHMGDSGRPAPTASPRSGLSPDGRDRSPVPVGTGISEDRAMERALPLGGSSAARRTDGARRSASAAILPRASGSSSWASASPCTSWAFRGRSRSRRPRPSSPPSSTPPSRSAWAASSTSCCSVRVSSVAKPPQPDRCSPMAERSLG